LQQRLLADPCGQRSRMSAIDQPLLSHKMLAGGLVVGHPLRDQIRHHLGAVGSKHMNKVIVVAAIALTLGGCAAMRENELRHQMDAEMSQCRAGDQAACQRYQLVLQQYKAEMATPRYGILGLPGTPPPVTPSPSAFTCTTPPTLPGGFTTTTCQ
jgi:hypothetical protein